MEPPANGIRLGHRRNRGTHRLLARKRRSEVDMSPNVLSFEWKGKVLFWTTSGLREELDSRLVLNRYGMTAPSIRVQRLQEAEPNLGFGENGDLVSLFQGQWRMKA